MKTKTESVATIGLAIAAITSCLLRQSAESQDLPGGAETNIIRFHENIGARFKAGDTNVPLLNMDLFKGGRHGCSVSKSGKVITGFSNGISNSTDWNRPAITDTNLTLLVNTLKSLPEPTDGSVPLYRQLHVSGVRDNKCFHFVYDIESPPDEVRLLYHITGATFIGAPKPEASTTPPKRP